MRRILEAVDLKHRFEELESTLDEHLDAKSDLVAQVQNLQAQIRILAKQLSRRFFLVCPVQRRDR